MEIEIEIEGGWPDQSDIQALAARACDAAASVAPEIANPRLSASVLFTSDAEGKRAVYAIR